jgi:hypothetical protein
MDKEVIGKKSVRITISQAASEKLKKLAGRETLPGAYLEKLIDDLAAAKGSKMIEPQLSEGILLRNEVNLKLDSLAHSIERLTNIFLENQRLSEQAGMASSPSLSGLRQSGPSNRYEPARSQYDKRPGQIGPNWEGSQPNPSAPEGNQSAPSFPPLEFNQEGSREVDTEEKIRKYEEDNPW